MSKKYEDYDEWCNSDNPRAVTIEEVTEASIAIKPYIQNTPCVPSNYQRDFVMYLYYKLEFLQKTGSVKERGAVNALELLSLDNKKIGICTASIGNEALSLCYYASQFKIPVTAVMTQTTSLTYLQTLQKLGANVIVHGTNLLESQRFARTMAREKEMMFINGRDHPHMLAGYGTIGLEILQQVPLVDAILVSVGSGGLAAMIATVVKHHKPNCLVYGVQSEASSCFFKSLESEEPLFQPTDNTVADGTAVPSIGYNSFFIAKPLLDKMLLVKEDWIVTAMVHLVEKERYIVEGAGATPLAALIGHLVPELKTKTVVCLLSGGNVDSTMLTRCLHRGLSTEGRLIKFHVGVNDNQSSKTQFFRILANGGYNVISLTEDHKWISDDTHRCQMSVVCETKGMAHALELKRIVDRNYPCTTIFETEPFNNKTLCPCYIRK